MKRMIKVLSLVFVVISAGYFLLDSRQLLTVFSQDKPVNIQTPQEREDDLRLAELIERLTNRSTEGLVEKVFDDGAVSINLEDRFQNVMLSKLDENGDSVEACVTSLGEANAFFGRDLKTGEPVEETFTTKDEMGKLADRHGMSRQEYEFYMSLIEAAEKSSLKTVTINVINNDGAGEGLNDPTQVAPEGGNNGTTLGQQRLNVLNFAASIWSAFLDSSVPINVRSNFDPQTCTDTSGTLGSAGSNFIFRDFPNAPFPNTFYSAALANKLAGSDQNPGSGQNPGHEINATYNSNLHNNPSCLGGGRFYYGFDNTPPLPAGTRSLLVVALHEMGHGLGFQSFANGSTGQLAGSDVSGRFPDIFIRFLYDRNMNKYWHQMTDDERKTSALSGGATNPQTLNLFWDGPNVKIASGSLTAGRDPATGRVAMHSPDPFVSGSSISHWTTAAFPNLLMEPSITSGLPLTLDLTRQQMRDIGWYRDTNLDLVRDTITNVQISNASISVGAQATVTWANTGGFNRNVTIELSTDGGATFPITIATDIANNGAHTFTVPNNPTAQARIRVREHNFVDPLGSSAANFTIATIGSPRNRKTVGVFRPSNGITYLRNSNTGGFADISMVYGVNGDTSFAGDWNADGIDSLGIYRNGVFYLRNSNTTGPADIVFAFGSPGDQPVAGDWNGDGIDTIGVYRPSTGVFLLRNSNTAGAPDLVFVLGNPGDVAIAGDWNGDGITTTGVFRPSNGIVYLKNTNVSGDADIGLVYGNAGDKPVAGDWDGDGQDSIGIYRNGVFYLRNSNTQGFADLVFALGDPGDEPIAGDWDGLP
jgi:hypothetical protein